jgi:hypothetical protein
MSTESTTIACRGLCATSCTIVPMTAPEVAQLQEALGTTLDVEPLGERRFVFTDAVRTGRCPALDEHGRCRAYAVRPAICRLYGLTPLLPCAYGCRPSRWLTFAEQEQLLGESLTDGPTHDAVEAFLERLILARTGSRA